VATAKQIEKKITLPKKNITIRKPSAICSESKLQINDNEELGSTARRQSKDVPSQKNQNSKTIISEEVQRNSIVSDTSINGNINIKFNDMISQEREKLVQYNRTCNMKI
jgi:hypothetical protein